MTRVSWEDLEWGEDGLLWHNGQWFTGTAVELHPNGALLDESAYEQGRRHGVGREYYPTGELKSEEMCQHGAAHGVCREWSVDGRLTEETHHAGGILLKRLEPDENGELQVTFLMTPNHAYFKMLPPEIQSQFS